MVCTTAYRQHGPPIALDNIDIIHGVTTTDSANFVWYQSLQLSLCIEFTGEVCVADTANYVAFIHLANSRI